MPKNREFRRKNREFTERPVRASWIGGKYLARPRRRIWPRKLSFQRFARRDEFTDAPESRRCFESVFEGARRCLPSRACATTRIARTRISRFGHRYAGYRKAAPRRFRRGQLAGIGSHPSADSRHFTNYRYNATRVIRTRRARRAIHAAESPRRFDLVTDVPNAEKRRRRRFRRRQFAGIRSERRFETFYATSLQCDAADSHKTAATGDTRR